MTPQAFIAHWQHNDISERSGAQQHFNDLCDLLGVEKPRDAENYCFERGAKTQGGQGWADVWKRGFFAWEYKAPGRDLNAALKQLMNYALALDNPPLLVVSDLRNIEIHTHFTGHPSEVHRISLAGLTQPEVRQKLLWLFTEPERFKPARTTFAVTEQAAGRMGDIAKRLTEKGLEPHTVAHFLIQCVFCMFAEDARLLPEKLFETVLDRSNPDGAKAQKRLSDLFSAMQGGGDFAMLDIPWFNGGLFEKIEVPALQTADVVSLLEAARMDWSQIEPAILGTLFERGLNPDMRSQLGAHYTDPATIMKIIHPVVEQPLLAEWEPLRAQIKALSPKMKLVGTANKNRPNKEMQEGYELFRGFLERLKNYRVLDAACGSGNFLYLALKTLKDIEHRVNLEAEALGLQRELNIEVSPANVLGIELNPYAAELARVTVWIGEIQWMLAHGYTPKKDPILARLDHIEQRDAVLELVRGTDITVRNERDEIIGTEGQMTAAIEPEWPAVDAIIGNPPFLGDKKMIAELGAAYTNALRDLYKGRVPGGADLVTYWFEKARAHIAQGKARYAGLVATNSIRQKRNRPVLERILKTVIPAQAGSQENLLSIFDAWSDEEWVNAGAAVRVSLVCFGINPYGLRSKGKLLLDSGLPAAPGMTALLDGRPAAAIHVDLTAGGGLDLTQAKPLKGNAGWSYFGLCLAGPFKIPAATAQAWLRLPNPHGRPNSDVLKPIYNGSDITKRWGGDWVIDFGLMEEHEAALYEAPFAYVTEHVKPVRMSNNRKARADKWWRHGEARPGLRAKLAGLPRYIATPETAKHRFFVWLPVAVAPEHRLVIVPQNNDCIFGVLSSRIHIVWALDIGGTLEDRPVYNSTLCFETFPFPAGCSPSTAVIPAKAGIQPETKTMDSGLPAASGITSSNEAIAAIARRLDELRSNWLNPPEWVDWVITPEEEKAGYPKRPVAKPGHEADLKKRTLTNLYNERPAWLDNIHKELDTAVASAYGWADYSSYMPDEEILRRLLRLNLERNTDS